VLLSQYKQTNKQTNKQTCHEETCVLTSGNITGTSKHRQQNLCNGTEPTVRYPTPETHLKACHQTVTWDCQVTVTLFPHIMGTKWPYQIPYRCLFQETIVSNMNTSFASCCVHNAELNSTEHAGENQMDYIMQIYRCLVQQTKLNSVARVCERTIPTERPPLINKVSANFLQI
jgi:hypothetical protein